MGMIEAHSQLLMQIQTAHERSRPPRALDQCEVCADYCVVDPGPREAPSHKIAVLDTTGVRGCRRAHPWRRRGIGCRGRLMGFWHFIAL